MSRQDSRQNHPRVITIDGPAASGKSSVSRGVAEKIGWCWVSTGAFYRGLAFVAQQKQISFHSEEELAALCKDPSWEIRLALLQTQVFFNGNDVTDEAHKEAIGSIASQISLFPKVRENLLTAQRECAVKGRGLIAEGRDCGTVIFPEALAKFFLTAGSKNRALRRAKEKGEDLRETLQAQIQRDAQDAGRASAPMKIPEGAHVVDTSQMNLNEVILHVYSLVSNLVK